MNIPNIVLDMSKWHNLGLLIKNSKHDFSIPTKTKFSERYRIAKEPKIIVKIWQTED